MCKNLVLALFSVFVMVNSSTSGASTCSYMSSDCMGHGMKDSGEKSMHSSNYFTDKVWDVLTKVEDSLAKVDDHVKSGSSYWGAYDKHDSAGYGMKHDKSGNKNKKHGNWLTYNFDKDDDDGMWMYGYSHGQHGFKGHHGKKGHHNFKKWWKKHVHHKHHDHKMPAIPVPAAAWLFGSGLIGLLAVSRRRKSS